MTEVIEPSKFQTKTTPQPKENHSRIQYDFDCLLGRHQGSSYVFVDYLFHVEDNLHGAIGTEMRAVANEEAQRREAKYRNPETSPYYWKYEKQNPSIGWTTWIKARLREDEHDVLYDTAYNAVYGDVVKEQVAAGDVLDVNKIHVIECVYGGRLDRFTEDVLADVYDAELLRLIHKSEADGLKHIYDS